MSFINYFLSNKLFNASQSDFTTGNSRIAHLLKIGYDIHTAFVSSLTVDVIDIRFI